MDKIKAIKLPVVNELEQFEKLFDEALFNSNPLLKEALAHIRQRKGKMMRPILVLLIARLFGDVSLSTHRSAVALELLHTASLVHDDVVDESDERRGQASVKAVYNNKVSILVGDYLLATCLVQANLTGNERIIEVVAKLGQDLSEGEILQLSNVSDTKVTEPVYFDVIRKKTAALFGACAKAGALSAGASEEEVDLAYQFGECVGICFQIKDDIFDYFDALEIGKPTGNDMREGKLTLPIIHALNATEYPDAKAVACKVKAGTATVDEISFLIDFAKQHGGIAHAEAKMNEYKCRAQSLFPDGMNQEVRNALHAYIEYVVERRK